MADDDVQTLVFDNGSHTIRAGVAGDDAPRTIFQTIVGRLKNPGTVDYAMQNRAFVGHDVSANSDMLTLTRPNHNACVDNWEDMQEIWNHAFCNELRVRPADHPILLTEKPKSPREQRDRSAQVMFETFNVPAVYFAIDAELVMYASGRGSGMVLDSGECASYVVPIHQGHVINDACSRLDVAGAVLSASLFELLQSNESQYKLCEYGKGEIIRGIKENVCYVALDHDQELTRPVDKTYKLPDGKCIRIGQEQFKCPELLFQPNLGSDKESVGIHINAYNTIMNCNSDIREYMSTNIVLAGGSTMFPGFSARLNKEIQCLAGPTVKTRIISAPERMLSVWIGGSILASLSTFKTMWTSKENYNEFGSSAIHWT
jgi:actin